MRKKACSRILFKKVQGKIYRHIVEVRICRVDLLCICINMTKNHDEGTCNEVFEFFALLWNGF